jgi:hypothetical protein
VVIANFTIGVRNFQAADAVQTLPDPPFFGLSQVAPNLLDLLTLSGCSTDRQQSLLFSRSQFDLLPRHTEQPRKYHYVRHQQHRHKKCGDVPRRFQIGNSLCLTQCIEQIQATDHVEYPYQRHHQGPSIAQRKKARNCQ